METDKMACPHHPDKAYVNVNGSLICPVCGRHSPYQHAPSYSELFNQTSILRKMLEDICECQEDRDELIDKARTLLQLP